MLPLLGEWSRNTSVLVCRMALLWEAAFNAMNFCEESFSAFARFMMGDFPGYLPTPCWLFSSFWTKNSTPPVPTLCIHPILPWATIYLFLWIKKVLKGKCFADVEEVKLKMAEVLKGIKIKFKNCFEQWKKSLDTCISSHGDYFEGD